MAVHFQSSREVVERLAPEHPVFCLSPRSLRQAAQRFCAGFPGDVLYAVKANPERSVIEGLAAGGIRHFDTASLGEIALIAKQVPEARCYFMHPVKGWEAIREAYHRYGLRHFVIDQAEELDKLIQVLGGCPADLVIVVRLATEGRDAVFDLSAKFGAGPELTVELLGRAAAAGSRVGLAFHVGSQCSAPASFGLALAQCREVIARAGVELVCLDVGGGFPIGYTGPVPPLELFFEAIRDGLAGLGLPPGCQVLCEPGRALVAEAQSLITQVHQRRGWQLYLNDGVYGGLRGTAIGMRYPVRCLSRAGGAGGALADFTIFGPTCDGLDVLSYALRLPDDIGPGDWIEFGCAGAYTNSLVCDFNGFRSDTLVTVEQGFEHLGEPLAGLFPALQTA